MDEVYEEEEGPPTQRSPRSEESEKKRGFARMTPEQVRAISSKGGKSAHARGTAHRWTTDQAREAGRKGGLAPRAKKAAA